MNITRSNTIALSMVTCLAMLLSGCRSADITAMESARSQFGRGARLGAPLETRGPRGRIDSVQPAYGASGQSGYVATVWCKSRSCMFPVRVIMDSDYRVLSASVLHYSATRGGDVRSQRFTRQFTGKGPGAPVRIGKDIDAVSGATSSSSAMAGGVRRAIRAAGKCGSEAGQ